MNWFLWQLQVGEGTELLAHGFDLLQGGGLRDQAGLAEGGHGGGELGEDRDALRRGGGGDICHSTQSKENE